MQIKEQRISPVKQRILQFADDLGISKREFYAKIGVSRGTLEAKTGITEDILAKFIAAFPDVSVEWIVTGRGDLYYANSISEAALAKSLCGNDTWIHGADEGRDIMIPEQVIPVYELTNPQTLTPLFDGGVSPSNYLGVFSLPKCDGAIRMWGDKMMPELQSGDLLVFKKVKDLRNGLHFGQIYLMSIEIDGEEYVTVQYIEEADAQDTVKIVSRNERYAAKDIPIDSIKALAMIKASVRYRAI